MEDIKYCVYMHTNKINGKKYIGQTYHQDDPSKRWGENGEGYGANDLNNEGHLARSIRKYGWDNFEHKILFRDLTKNDADLLEDYYIRYYGTTDSKLGYNKRFGGSQGALSDETKQRISEKLRSPEIHKKISDKVSGEKNGMYRYGERLTDEERKKYITTAGKIWVNDGNEEKYVEPNELQQWLDKGWIKGRKPFSEEAKQHIGEGGRKRWTPELRTSFSEKMRGENNPNYGRHHTEEARRHMSEAHKGKSSWNKGIPMSEEAKRKLSEAHKKENLSAETRRKMSETQRLRGLGCKWVNDGTTSKFVKPDEVQHYLDLGWQIGRGTLLDQTGKLWVTNDKENVRIRVDELEHYLNIGYKRGMCRHGKTE